MKKILVLMFVLVATFFAAQMEVSAKSRPVSEPSLWTEQSMDYGVDLDICVNGFHSFAYNIYAGQNTYAGTVAVYLNGEGDFVFSVDLIDGALAQELHVYAYTSLSSIPSKRPAPGQAPYKLGAIYLNEFEYVIDGNELVDGQTYYFVFHLALVDEDVNTPSGVAGETAYVGGPNGPTKGAWFYALGFTVEECETVVPMPTLYVAFHTVVGGETVWAVGETTLIELGLTNSRWGWQLTFDENPETFDLYAGAAQNNLSKGTYIGTLTLSWDGEYVTFTLDLVDGVVLTEIHIHVDYTPVDTISPGQLGYIATSAYGPYTDAWTVSLLPETDR